MDKYNAILISEMLIFSDRNFPKFLAINLGLKPDPDPDPHGNLCGSETLHKRKNSAGVEKLAEDYSYVHQQGARTGSEKIIIQAEYYPNRKWV
jgi:hypothetical protein